MRWVLTNLLDREIAPVATLIYFILQFAGKVTISLEGEVYIVVSYPLPNTLSDYV